MVSKSPAPYAPGPVHLYLPLQASLLYRFSNIALLTESIIFHNYDDYNQVYPNSYSIFLETVYEDLTCSPPSSVNRTELNSPVLCHIITGDPITFPKLTDFDAGPEDLDGLSSPPTDVAYILNGTCTTSGLYKRWIEFNFFWSAPLTRVTLHYYCNGTPPQLKLSSDVMTTPLRGL